MTPSGGLPGGAAAQSVGAVVELVRYVAPGVTFGSANGQASVAEAGAEREPEWWMDTLHPLRGRGRDFRKWSACCPSPGKVRRAIDRKGYVAKRTCSQLEPPSPVMKSWPSEVVPAMTTPWRSPLKRTDRM
jgi:hypothetical protein